MKEQLLIFTRFPEPGTTKTRLAKYLGEEGVVVLQKKLTEHTLSQARLVMQIRQVEPIVYFTGGSHALMQDWLGTDLRFLEQGKGDLGQRLQLACAAAFNQSSKRVVIIGTDCPGLQAHHLVQAFDALDHKDIILGPATDGGYYLVGMKKNNRALFTRIHWGTGTVLADTIKAGEKLGLSIELLDILSDVDRPKDLRHFRHYPDI
jgi:rSAM/selenodomain-associated transferase 1